MPCAECDQRELRGAKSRYPVIYLEDLPDLQQFWNKSTEKILSCSKAKVLSRNFGSELLIQLACPRRHRPCAIGPKCQVIPGTSRRFMGRTIVHKTGRPRLLGRNAPQGKRRLQNPSASMAMINEPTFYYTQPSILPLAQ